MRRFIVTIAAITLLFEAGRGQGIDVDLVNLDVIVTDRTGEIVSGLTKEQFKVFADGVEQRITHFSSDAEPITTVILMQHNPIRAAAGFINILRPNDRAALVTYDAVPENLTSFTQSKDVLLEALNRPRIAMSAQNCLFDALWDTLNRLDGYDERKVIFLASTGMDDVSGHGYPQLLERAGVSQVTIYPLSLPRNRDDNEINELQARNVLGSLAEETGGTAFFPRNESEYPAIFETVSRYVRGQYSLGFVPSQRRHDGKRHRLRVEVLNSKAGKLVVKHRKGYDAL
jgi:Ca-activated chloride channel family protein